MYRYAPRRSCWRSVGPHGECGFDAGGLPARFRKRPRAGALRSAGTLAAQRSLFARREGEASGGLALGYHSGRNARECGGTSLVPAIFTKFMTESLPLCPLLGGGAAKGGDRTLRGSGRCLGNKGDTCGLGDSGRDIPMAVKGEPKRTVELRPPLHPDTRLNASQDGF